MPFLEPRPHRRPFHATTLMSELTVSPKLNDGDLAITSFTGSSQSGNRMIIIVASKDGEDEILFKLYIPEGQTLHMAFPHPVMIGIGRTLKITPLDNTGGFMPMTVVGYEWNDKDLITFLYSVGEAITNLFRRKDP